MFFYPDKSKKVYHANYYTIPIGIAQLNTFSCAKKVVIGKYNIFPQTWRSILGDDIVKACLKKIIVEFSLSYTQ